MTSHRVTAVSREQVSVRTCRTEVEAVLDTHLSIIICLAGSSGGTREATLAILEIRPRAEWIPICRELTGAYESASEPPVWDLRRLEPCMPVGKWKLGTLQELALWGLPCVGLVVGTQH